MRGKRARVTLAATTLRGFVLKGRLP
jgi:hypothetical protein